MRPSHVWGLLLAGHALAYLPCHARQATKRMVAIETTDIIYDQVSQKIYASVPSSALQGGNSITVIDPFTGAVEQSISVGSEPGKLAVSDDGHYLYVSLDGAAAIARVDLISRVSDLQFSLGNDPFSGLRYAEDIEVPPGEPEAVAVSLQLHGVSPRFAGVAVYDHGVERPVEVPGFGGTDDHVNEIEFSDLASRLYGGSNTSVPTRFYRLALDNQGVSIIDDTHDVIPGGYI
jgi:YVTN family beta-propeller protein